ncbi:MAG: large subunit ribosomal protein L10 [Arenicella sp.]|jgi:large subunit ribosomal protein L10
MTKQEKYALVDALSEKLANTENFYITNTGGMTVKQINSFRGLCYKADFEYKIVKNTLIAKALERLDNGTDYSEFSDIVLKGTSGIIFGGEAANAPAKMLKEFKKSSKWEQPLLKGASIDGFPFIGAEHLEALSTLKSKNELIGDIIGLLQSPATNVISALQSGGQTLTGILKTLEEREVA